ncbi:hypothetical protein [Paenibacillus sp. LHD-38]|uniref:hypothetical protein n=1 Tax=Paenibacillus sp. LHD-38 TaxID=3072143 RepID=UPI00280D4A3C|nr:hypothetical protein [Paenibacillus sp. LHD-38]MDQ8733554.1 hypothetical protein [Paenibacillus sp. LHD-38]
MLNRCLANTGVKIPAIGQGTWKFGENKNSEKQEIEALRFRTLKNKLHRFVITTLAKPRA